MAEQQTWQAGLADLVQTKLVPPHVRPQLATRGALIERLDGALNGKLTLVSAPAGFGKTTLVADWLRGQAGRLGAAWVALDTRDNDPIRFWRYLLAACQAFDRVSAPLGNAVTEQHESAAMLLPRSSSRSGWEPR